MSKNSTENECGYMTRRIGSTVYRIKVVFPNGESETVEDKILRMIQNEGLASGTECGTMSVPQMSRQSERSA